MIKPSFTHTVLGLTAAASLGACSVGPDYNGPPDAAPIASRSATFHRAATADPIAADPSAQWWQTLGDPTLNKLIVVALRDNLTIEQNQARLRSARATLSQQRAGLLPTGGANAAAVRTQLPTGVLTSGASSLTTNLFDAGFDATWELDIFGGQRRAIESARDSACAQAATLADAQVQLAAEVAQAYVNLRDSQRRLALIQHAADVEQRMLNLTRQRLGLGTASDSDVARLETQVQQTAAQVPTLQAQVERYLDQIAVLEAVEPGQLDAELTAPVAVPMPPADVAVGDPAAMLRRRPDIREAERQLAASTAKIGVRVADYFPKVSLFGSIGFVSTDAAHLFTGNSLNYLGGPTLSWNILNFPQTTAKVNEAKADRDAAVAQYRGTVLSALQDAETALSRYGRQRTNVAHLAAAEAAAARAAALGRQRYQAGTASLIDTLDVERQSVQTQQDLAQGQAMLTNDYVSLQKALGLGWKTPSEETARLDAGAGQPG